MEKIALYNFWANKVYTDWLMNDHLKLLDKEIPNSFNSLLKTMSHIWFAQHVWLCRIEGIPIQAALFNSPMFSEISEGLTKTSRKLLDLVKDLQGKTEEITIQYKTTQGKSYSNTANDILIHVFNHSTYHRGQIVTMMRSERVQNIPQTDYIHFLRVQNV